MIRIGMAGFPACHPYHLCHCMAPTPGLPACANHKKRRISRPMISPIAINTSARYGLKVVCNSLVQSQVITTLLSGSHAKKLMRRNNHEHIFALPRTATGFPEAGCRGNIASLSLKHAYGTLSRGLHMQFHPSGARFLELQISVSSGLLRNDSGACFST